FCDLDVHFRNQRAGCIEDLQTALLGLAAHGPGYAMRRKNDDGATGRIVEFIDENCALFVQILYDVPVMYDFMPHVNGATVQFEGSLDDLDGTIDARAKAARLCQHE